MPEHPDTEHVYNGWPKGDESVCSCGWNPTAEQRDEPRAMRSIHAEHVEEVSNA